MIEAVVYLDYLNIFYIDYLKRTRCICLGKKYW